LIKPSKKNLIAVLPSKAQWFGQRKAYQKNFLDFEQQMTFFILNYWDEEKIVEKCFNNLFWVINRSFLRTLFLVPYFLPNVE